MKYILFICLKFFCIGVSAQWTTTAGIVSNTNVGPVSIVRNTGFNNGQIFIVNPNGGGKMTIGEANTGAGGFTSLSLGISSYQNGYTFLQAVKSAGSAYGNIILNEGGGAVGIGTANPGSFKLAVEGKIGAREIKVTNTNPWPDYVFESNYKLMDLEELTKYIAKHKHLPGVPSASEINEDGGVNLGEMSRKLLEKIEELTLYTIELKRQNDLLQSQILQIQNQESN